MGDYAGAVAAIKQRMADNWTTTPVGYQNEPDPQTTDGNGVPAPWVYFEVIGNTSDLRGMGRPGDHVWLYAGMIAAHVFVPMNTGTDLAQQLRRRDRRDFSRRGVLSRRRDRLDRADVESANRRRRKRRRRRQLVSRHLSNPVRISSSRLMAAA
jgi:hypothetical protein